MWCSVMTCKSGSWSTKYKTPSHVKFYRFPKNDEIAKIWVDACGQSNLNTNIAYMCSLHFEPKSYDRPLIHQTVHNYLPRCQRKLTPLAIPTINICTTSTEYDDKKKLGTTTSTEIADDSSDNITEQSERELSITIENDCVCKGIFEKHSPTVVRSDTSVDQSEFNIEDNSHRSIKSENDMYFDADIPLLTSVKQEVTFCHDNDDSDHIFQINNNINNNRQEKCIKKYCKVNTQDYKFNNRETVIKEEPEDKDFQPHNTDIRKEYVSPEPFKLEVEYKDKIIKIEKEIVEDTLYESEIVIEKSGVHSSLNEEKYNAGYNFEISDSPRSIYKDLVEFQSKSDKHIYICDLCNQSFNSKKLLIFHMKYHFPNDYCMDNTSKRVCSKNIKRRKPKISKNRNKYECTICCKKFNDYSNCRRHIINHSSTKKFKCHFCNKLYTTEYSLCVHIRVHTGEFPYECDICNLQFYRNDAMLTHRRIHGGKQLTYNCKDCHKVYSSIHSLLRQTKSHRTKTILSCNYCQRTYNRKDSLAVHLRSKHMGNKPYKCHICKKDFFENSVLLRHMKIHINGKKNK